MTVVNEFAAPSHVFIVDMNGSGTTMLRDHLANHSWIFGYPDETTSLPYFILHQREYGDSNSDENFLRLWQAMKTSLAKSTRLQFNQDCAGGTKASASTNGRPRGDSC